MKCMKDCIYAVSALLWFLILNFLTFQKGTESVEVSGRIAGVIKSLVSFGFHVDDGVLEKRIRFLAHPIGFGVLAGLSLSALIVAEKSDWIAMIIAFLLFWSIASEVLKIPISGRHCHGFDIVGNLIGVGVGSVGSLLTTMM